MQTNGAPTWAIEPGGVVLKRGDVEQRFRVTITEPELFLGYGREFYRQARMSAVLATALDKFESGQADYKNAAANLDHLTRELGTVNQSLIGLARSFWAFTDAAGNKKRTHELELIFNDHGDLLCEMVAEVCRDMYSGGEARKNLLRGLGGPLAPEPPQTATPAGSSTSSPKEAQPGPGSGEKKSETPTAAPAPSSSASPEPSAGGKKAG